MKFTDFSTEVAKQFQKMTKSKLYRVDVDKNTLWDTYLKGFPEGTNPIFRERTEYDCNCCKSFIRNAGGIVTIQDGKLVSIWDIEIGGAFQVVADAMSRLVKSYPITNIFLTTESKAGVLKSVEVLDSGKTITWNHFFVNIPKEYVTSDKEIGPRLSTSRSTYDVMLRSLKEITIESIDTVLDLISQNSLYRGEEHKYVLQEFRKLRVEFENLKSASTPIVEQLKAQDAFVWSKLQTIPSSVSRIRSTVIGTLLCDLSEGYDLEDCVKSFESKVAPTNYKRPTALVTKAMVEKAQKTIEEMGYTSALERRYARVEDISINNLLFADRSFKEKNVFTELAASIPEKVQKLDTIEEITIEDFIKKVLPRAESLEVMFENRHSGNLVSLIAPVDPTAKSMFKWDNNFSWTYRGDLADSIKERVKQAGGKVNGDFRASLAWFNYDDLDLHLIEPDKNEIYYANKKSYNTNGQLDVDMNAGGGHTRTPVENIFYPNRKKMEEGTYKLLVHNFSKRETKDVGFEVELEFDGTTYTFSYQKAVLNGGRVNVATFTYSHKEGIKIIDSLPSNQTSKTIWNLATQTFHKVNAVTLSPNYWDDKSVLQKHYFFLLDRCHNEDKARGFYNEFLKPELDQHRKVFEMVGARMRTDESEHQLSGIGFSSTQHNSLLCRVKGSITRTLKITF